MSATGPKESESNQGSAQSITDQQGRRTNIKDGLEVGSAFGFGTMVDEVCNDHRLQLDVMLGSQKIKKKTTHGTVRGSASEDNVDGFFGLDIGPPSIQDRCKRF